ncbi:MAG TPA: superoxide dismutase [Cu-Zn] SodC [Polyangia bacterium]|nr:superoxide dismutase [Cu-Zn] SodC [Polyangia bacterium]
MKTLGSALVFVVSLGGLTAQAAKPDKVTVKVNLIDTKGVGQPIGTVTLQDSKDGVTLTTKLKGLTAGEHGFHVHEKGSCDPAEKEGKPMAGLGAGGHFDPDATKAHKGPGGGGHKGDLPKLEVSDKGTANAKLEVPGVKVADLRGKALMIHANGDNYADDPKPLGGGGDRVACGVIPDAK